MMDINSVKTRYGIVGHAPRLLSAIEVAMRVAPTEVTVLIQGENGTGKDVFSRIIHQHSKRKHQNFMAINCGAIPEGTMDSELFGHEKGAFTSAIGARKGYFEEVNGGTIFLDEIAEMPLATQSRLLRVLENGEYIRVGSSQIRKTDVRVIAATNKNLVELIRAGKFREDLYFRLNTVSIFAPPLRERGDDIELLFRWFAGEFSHKYNSNPLTLDDEAVPLLYKYRWPGNIRELRNLVEKLTVLVPDGHVDRDILNAHLNVQDSYLPGLSEHRAAPETVEEQAREINRLYSLISELRTEMGEMKKLLFMGLQSGFKGNSDFIQEAEDMGYGSAIIEGGDYRIERREDREPAQQPMLLEESLSLEKKEKEMIAKALGKHRNNRKKAAQELGISERTLYRKIKQYEIA